MKTIWKYKLDVNDNVFIEMPKGAQVLSVQIQDGAPCIWALVDPDAKKEKRLFEVLGTGHTMPEDMGINRAFIGTFQLWAGRLVFHLFERL